MKKLLVVASAYIAILLTPTATTSATIVETFAVPFPIEAELFLNFGVVLGSTNFQQFNPALGTLNTVQVTLAGSFNWFPELDSPTHTLIVTNELGGFSTTQTFLGIPVTDDTVPVTVNLTGTTSNPFVLNFLTGTSFANDRVDLNLLSLSAFPDQIIAVGPNDQIVSLQGTVTYDYTPTTTPVPSAWIMMLGGVAVLGVLGRPRKSKAVFA